MAQLLANPATLRIGFELRSCFVPIKYLLINIKYDTKFTYKDSILKTFS